MDDGKSFWQKLKEPVSMKIFLAAVALILLIGLSAGGYIYYLNYYNPKREENAFEKGPVTSLPSKFNLELTNPDDNLLVFDKSVVISGNTSPNATILISSESKNIGFEASSSGDFSKVFDLSPGLNELVIAAFDKDGNNKEIKRNVFYSEEKI